MDMNAFFASVEQRANPALRGKAIAVVGSAERTVVTTASYEARAFGVKTGMNKYEAKRLCPSIIFVIGDNRKYVDASVRIFGILKGFSPMVEAYSIDEAFVDITGSLRLFGEPRDIARAMKKRVMDALGLTCSIGIAPNKLLAKLASDMKKPDGLVIIEPEDVAGVLKDLPVNELWGIGPRLTERLAALGVMTCAELGAYPVGILRQKFGIIGERLHFMGQGIYDSPVAAIGEEEEAKSVGHSTTLPADISDKVIINRHLLKLSEMVCARARRHGLKGRKVSLTLRYPDFFTFTRQTTLSAPTNDTRAVYNAAKGILAAIRLRSAIRLLGVCVSGIVKNPRQIPLFEDERKREELLSAMDEVNGRFGGFTLTWGSLLESGEQPWVISPSWRPEGVKRVEG
ncbi:MAG: DNA polymerase IV [Deltaproteobacteria bacterium]|nr:DNA polymerase IV [Deltaproteobacteria bacterium]